MTRCDNQKGIVPPLCGGKPATSRPTIYYNAVESDTLDVCQPCGRQIAADARHHGYRTTLTRVRQ